MIVEYSINSSFSDKPFSPQELIDTYFFGIPLLSPTGSKMSDESLEFTIQAAIDSVEGFLNLKLTKQIVEETLSYSLNDWKKWGYIPTSYPVLAVHELSGFIGDIKQVTYPKEWLSIKRSSVDTDVHRKVNIIPSTGTTTHYAGSSIMYGGISPHLGWFGNQNIPDYWTIKYCTSFNKVPSDILDFIGKLAAINVFHQLGDIILGAGIASQSIGIDGLSQSISTTSSATNAGYGARITGYLSDLKLAKDRLKNKYDGFEFTSL